MALDHLTALRPPRLDEKIVQPLDDLQLKALIAACQGREMRDRRDEALARLMLETGCRAGEVVAMEVAGLDLAAGLAVIRRGKGGKGRTVPIGPHASRALDRYLRTRRSHRLADSSASRVLLPVKRRDLGQSSSPPKKASTPRTCRRSSRDRGPERASPVRMPSAMAGGQRPSRPARRRLLAAASVSVQSLVNSCHSHESGPWAHSL